MQLPKIKITADAFAEEGKPVFKVTPLSVEDHNHSADTDADTDAHCANPDCPVCRWAPFVEEIIEHMQDTEVYKRSTEGNYAIGFSLAAMPLRVTDELSGTLMDLMEGLENSTLESTNLIIPHTLVETTLESVQALLEENDDFLTLTVINDSMIEMLSDLVGRLVNEDTAVAAKQEAIEYLSNLELR